MHPRHKNKAIFGIILWLLGPLLAVFICAVVGALLRVSDPHDFGAFGIGVFLVAQYGAFFWGGSHLARAKGYSNAILLWGVLCPLGQLVVLAVLLFAMPDKCPTDRDREHSHRRERRHEESPISRIVRYRRNALVANVIGISGILLALALAFIHTGLFKTSDNQRAAALLVFVPGFVSIILGCWYWLKAKNWPDAVLFIGFMPLAPLVMLRGRTFRTFYITSGLSSGILPLLMVLMPILLIAVVAVLPDKSGMPKRQRSDHE